MQQHKVQKKPFGITKACDDDLKQQTLAAIQNFYLKWVANSNVGFAQTTTLELINHLDDSYVTITSR